MFVNLLMYLDLDLEMHVQQCLIHLVECQMDYIYTVTLSKL